MSRAEIIHIMQAQGFTHVLSKAGPILLEDWQPYGEAGHDWQGEVIGNDKVRDLPKRPDWAGFFLGIWTFVTQ